MRSSQKGRLRKGVIWFSLINPATHDLHLTFHAGRLFKDNQSLSALQHSQIQKDPVFHQSQIFVASSFQSTALGQHLQGKN